MAAAPTHAGSAAPQDGTAPTFAPTATPPAASEPTPPRAVNGLVLGTTGIAVLVGVALLLTYLVEVTTPFAATDDYYVLSMELRSGGLSHSSFMRAKRGEPSLVQSLARGCFTSALLTSRVFEAAGSVSNLRYVRLIGLLGIALLAALLIRALTRAGWPPWRAGVVAFAMCVVPAFQVCASWALLFSVFFSCAATGVACELTLRALDPRPPWRQRAWKFALAILLLLFAVTIYQVSVMFFVVFAAIHVFRPSPEAARDNRSLVGLTLMMGIGLALGFVAFKIGVHFYGNWLPAARRSMVTDLDALGEKLAYVLRGPWAQSFQPGALEATPMMALLYAALVFGGLFLYLQGTLRQRLLRLGLAVLLVPGIYLPNMLTSENWGAFRTQLCLGPLVIL